MHDCYLCERKESAPFSGGRYAECAARWEPKPKVTVLPVVISGLRALSQTARVVKYKAPLLPVEPEPPYVKAWAAGGCMVCGGPEREDYEYAHPDCCDETPLPQWGAWWRACNEWKEANP